MLLCEVSFATKHEGYAGQVPRGNLLRPNTLRGRDYADRVFARLGGASGEAWAEPCEARRLDWRRRVMPLFVELLQIMFDLLANFAFNHSGIQFN